MCVLYYRVNVHACTCVTVTGFPSPQGSVHGQPQVGSPSTPGPGGSGRVGGVGGIRRNRAGWREWRRADPTLINSLWKSKMGHGIRKQLGTYTTNIIVQFNQQSPYPVMTSYYHCHQFINSLQTIILGLNRVKFVPVQTQSL